MTAVRAVFEKRRRAKYISHLDLMRCMQRAFRRANVPIYYTEGYNPHAYLMFPLPLSLGIESGCECMDFRLEGDFPMQEAMERLNAVLPPDLQILSVAEPFRKHTDIAFAEYAVTIDCGSSQPEELMSAWNAFFSQPEILVEKKTKRGTAQINLKEKAELLSALQLSDGIQLQIRLPAGNAVNLNPGILTDAFLKALPEGFAEMLHTERLSILCTDGCPFR